MKTDTIQDHPALVAKLRSACLPNDGVQRTLSESLAKLAEIKASIIAEYFAKLSKLLPPATLKSDNPTMTTPPFQHQFFLFGEIATITHHTSGITELQLARWSEPSEVELTEIREAFGSASLVQCPHLTLNDVLPASC